MKASDSTAEAADGLQLTTSASNELSELARYVYQKKTCQIASKQNCRKDLGYMSESLRPEHKSVVVDMVARSFADKGDLTTLANVTYENLVEQVKF